MLSYFHLSPLASRYIFRKEKCGVRMFRIEKANLGTWIGFSSCLWLEKLECKGEKQKGIAKDSQLVF